MRAIMQHSLPTETRREQQTVESDNRGESSVSMGRVLRQVEAEQRFRDRRRVEVGVKVELLLRVNLSMVVYGE